MRKLLILALLALCAPLQLLAQTTTYFTGTEGSNANASNGSAPNRDLYTNCAMTCVSGTPSPSPFGQLWCSAGQRTTGIGLGCSGLNGSVLSTVTGTGTHALSNGLGAGGTDSLTNMIATYGGALAGDCGTAINTPSALIPGLILPGAVTNSREVFSGTTDPTNFNTSLLAPTKFSFSSTAADHYVVQSCVTVPTTTGTGFHLEMDLNHTLPDHSYVGPGSHYNFPLLEWDYCMQGCSGWKKMNLVSGGVTVTPAFPAGHHIYMEWAYSRTPSCSSSSTSQCVNYDAACFQDYTAGSPMVCGQWKDATTGLTPGGIPVLKSSFPPEINTQIQMDYDQGGITRSVNVDFRNVVAYSAAWSTFIDPTRAVDWSGAGFTIPPYSVNCATQLIGGNALTAGSGAATTNANNIMTALNSCDGTHNVVNVPTGTWYVANFSFGTQGNQVLRGAGPNSTYIFSTNGPIYMVSNPDNYGGSTDTQYGTGIDTCNWTGGLAKGSTSITLSSCNSAPPLNQTIILDQINDSSDTSGIFVCDNTLPSCAQEAGPGDNEGRKTGGITRNEQQVVYTTGVTSLGGGSYTVTIATPIFFNNVRSGQQPGAWWPGFVQHDGIENLTLDYSASAVGDTDFGALFIWNCYQCWVKNIRSLYGQRDSVNVLDSDQVEIRDSYFYQTKDNHHHSIAYCVEATESSQVVVENNIFQQQSTPVIFQNGSGDVAGYNFTVGNIYDGSPGFMAGSYYSHNGGVEMNLWEGNNMNGIWADDIHGASPSGTLFRNMVQGWQKDCDGAACTNSSTPIILRVNNRVFNDVGNVLGQPGYHTNYQQVATGSSTFTGVEAASIYSIGLATSDLCSSGNVTACDTLAVSSLMRWGNYDTVNAAVRWNSTEAAPGAVTYAAANFSTGYFGTLAHTLPASLYYSSTPSWWPSGKAWPPIGPDVSSGNVGMCTGGTYAGAQTTSSGQCVGGTKSTAWGLHVTSIPAMDCYLTLGGPLDGSGSVLPYDAKLCYTPAPPTNPPAPTFLITLGD